MSLVTEQQITSKKEGSAATDDKGDNTVERIYNNRAARHAPGIALLAVVRRAAEADGEKKTCVQYPAGRSGQRTHIAYDFSDRIHREILSCIDAANR